MVLWRFKSCPRCKGDLFISMDMHVWFEQCLQCSHRRDLKNLDEFQLEKETTPTGRTPTGKKHT